MATKKKGLSLKVKIFIAVVAILVVIVIFTGVPQTAKFFAPTITPPPTITGPLPPAPGVATPSDIIVSAYPTIIQQGKELSIFVQTVNCNTAGTVQVVETGKVLGTPRHVLTDGFCTPISWTPFEVGTYTIRSSCPICIGNPDGSRTCGGFGEVSDSVTINVISSTTSEHSANIEIFSSPTSVELGDKVFIFTNEVNCALNSGRVEVVETGQILSPLIGSLVKDRCQAIEWDTSVNVPSTGVYTIKASCMPCVENPDGSRTCSGLIEETMQVGVGICGDGICQISESSSSCPQDCPAARCGDGVCQSSESATSCPTDCAPGQCTGTHISCDNFAGDPIECQAHGCTPSGRGGQNCIGTPHVCSSFTNQRNCDLEAAAGCIWQPTRGIAPQPVGLGF